MMLKLVCSFLLCIVVGRWGYEELKLISPDSIPRIDSILETITPTTHDKWPSISYERTSEGLKVTLIQNTAGETSAEIQKVRVITFPGPSRITGL